MKSSVLFRVMFYFVLLVGLSVCLSACSPGKEVQQDAGTDVRHVYERELARPPPPGGGVGGGGEKLPAFN